MQCSYLFVAFIVRFINLIISMRKHNEDFVRSNIVIGAAYTKVFLFLSYKYSTNVCHMFQIIIQQMLLREMELYINNENALSGGARNGKLHTFP